MLLNEIARHHQCHVLQPGTKLRNGFDKHQESVGFGECSDLELKPKFLANIWPGTGLDTQNDKEGVNFT